MAFIANDGNVQNVIYVADTGAGTTREIARGTALKGLAWLPDGSGLVYASATGSTLSTRRFSICAPCRGTGPTIGSSQSAKSPTSIAEIVQPGKIFASRIQMQSDIWRFPISGPPLDNVRNATRLTRQTAQVQTPSPSPDGKQIAYLSNSGGQGNVWVANTDGSGTARSLTTESDPSVVVGVPLWSPTSDWIVYIKTRVGQSRAQCRYC